MISGLLVRDHLALLIHASGEALCWGIVWWNNAVYISVAVGQELKKEEEGGEDVNTPFTGSYPMT